MGNRWKSPQLTTYEIDVLIEALEHRGTASDLRLAAKLMYANGYNATAPNAEARAAQLEQALGGKDG